MKLGGWYVVEISYDKGAVTHVHVMPEDDLREHVTDMLTNRAQPDGPDVPACWCNPFIEPNGAIAHNSLDGREEFEEGVRTPS